MYVSPMNITYSHSKVSMILGFQVQTRYNYIFFFIQYFIEIFLDKLLKNVSDHR